MSGEKEVREGLAIGSGFHPQGCPDSFREDIDRVGMVKRGLHGGIVEAWTALGLFPYMETSERLQCFDDLIFLSFSQRYGSLVTQIISALPREWVLKHIERSAEPLLRGADSIDYRMLLQLFLMLDTDLAMRLALMAAVDPDVDIAESGNEYINIIKKTH